MSYFSQSVEAEELSLPNIGGHFPRDRGPVWQTQSLRHWVLGNTGNQLLQLLLDCEGRDWVCWMCCWFPVPNIMPGTRQVLNKPLWDERRNEWSLLLFLKSPYGNFYVEFYYIQAFI